MSERTVAVLLGAGASVDAGIPATVKMTEAVLARMNSTEQSRLLEFVRHTIAAGLAEQKTAPWSREPVDVDVDVERLFAAIELLIDRHDQPWSPFVSTWHPALERFAPHSPTGLSSARMSLERAIGGIVEIRGVTRLAEEMVKFVDAAVKRGRGEDVRDLLVQVRNQMLRSLFDVLSLNNPAKVDYLLPLIELARTQRSLTVATLNYDRSIENAAELAGEACDTGLETWLTSGALDWGSEGLRLLKLHGSIDWVFERNGREQGELPLKRIRKVDVEEKPSYDAPAVVFGEAGKLRAEGPFVELLLAWSTQLQEADSLLIVGYSFRDTHINEIIARWFNRNASRRIVVVDPRSLEPATGRSFSWYLMHVDDVFPERKEPPTPRVRHIKGTTKASLAAAIAEAQAKVSEP